MAFYLYSETAFHHQGDLEYLKRLIDLSAKCGANGVKFQVLTDLDYLISSKHTQYQLVGDEMLTVEEWKEALTYCTYKGLDIIFMPINPTALDLLDEPDINAKYIDIHSVSFYDTPTLHKIKEKGLPVILGIGGRVQEEIDDKIAFFGSQLAVLMVGFQSFPSKLENLNLEKITSLGKLYPKLHIGYADHSSFEDRDAVVSNEYAYILGARVFEKHITADEGVERDDYESAVGEEKFATIQRQLTYLDQLVLNKPNESILDLNEAETKYRNRERVFVAKKDLKEGQVLGEEHIIQKMLDKQGGFIKSSDILGRKVNKAIEKDDLISSDCLE